MWNISRHRCQRTLTTGLQSKLRSAGPGLALRWPGPCYRIPARRGTLICKLPGLQASILLQMIILTTRVPRRALTTSWEASRGLGGLRTCIPMEVPAGIPGSILGCSLGAALLPQCVLVRLPGASRPASGKHPGNSVASLRCACLLLVRGIFSKSEFFPPRRTALKR